MKSLVESIFDDDQKHINRSSNNPLDDPQYTIKDFGDCDAWLEWFKERDILPTPTEQKAIIKWLQDIDDHFAFQRHPNVCFVDHNSFGGGNGLYLGEKYTESIELFNFQFFGNKTIIYIVKKSTSVFNKYRTRVCKRLEELGFVCDTKSTRGGHFNSSKYLMYIKEPA